MAREVNTQRPSRATGSIPAVRLEDERPRLRPLKVAPGQLALRVPIVSGRRRRSCMTPIPTRCRPTRSAFPGRCFSIGIACASSPAASRPSISASSSRTPSRRCRSIARNTSPPCPASARNGICSGSTAGARGLGPGLSDRAHPSPPAHLDSRCRSLARAARHLRRRGAARRVHSRTRRAGDRRRVHRALPGRRGAHTTADRGG